jgi:acyl-coenzyme A thioesterase PaaI-like protein
MNIEPAGGADFARMIEELRRLQDKIAATRPPAEVIAETANSLAELVARLAPHSVPEAERICGKRWDLVGRGQAFVPPIAIDHSDSQHRRGRVTFKPTHLGAGGVVHGGVIPLVFVEMLGLLVNSADRPVSRLAYLNVDFRAPVLVGSEVHIEARLLRTEGRKIFIAGALSNGQTELSVAEALFVVPRSV